MYGYFNNFVKFDELWAWEPELLWNLAAIANQTSAEGPLNAIINGTPGDDTLFDTLGDDTISGLAGDDTIHTSGGRNTLNGGDGSDTLVLNNAAVILFLDQASVDGFLGFTDGSGTTFLTSNFTSFERFIGSDGDDTLVVLSSSTYTGDLYFDGGAGNDFLYISAFNGTYTGSVTLIGGDGDDFMRGGQGMDSYDGGAGIDRVSLFNIAFGVPREQMIIDLRIDEITNDSYGNTETITDVENISGGSYLADILHGDDQDNFIFGSGGGADSVYGYGGDDTLIVLEAGGTIDGGDGVDTFQIFDHRYVNADVNLDGIYDLEDATMGNHIDLSTGQILNDGFGGTGTLSNIENLAGWGLNDTLIGDDNDNVLTGNFGDDVLTGNDGFDTARFNGDVTNFAFFSNPDGSITVVDEISFEGSDTLNGIERLEFFDGTTGATLATLDIETGTAGDDSYLASGAIFYDGLGGDDRIIGSAETDILFGGDGADTIHGRDGDDSLDGGGGNDRLGGGNGADTLNGGDGDDYLAGVNGDDILNGGDGNDALFGGAGNDQLIGGTGRDVLQGQGGNDMLFGGDANDKLLGGSGDDNLNGGIGDDIMFGGAGDDRLYGSQQNNDDLGADRLIGGGGNDYLEGHGGNDYLSGGGGDDVMIGDGFFTAVAAHGDDVLNGGHGNDQMYGYGGNDILNGGTGADFLFGMSGDDIIIAGGGHDQASGGNGADNIRGGGGNDILFGDFGDDVIDGGAGNDNIIGGEGIDILTGAGGKDRLDGGGGNDTLDGGGGNDWLRGGVGDDMLTGGSMSDRFEFLSGFGADTITDFENNRDKIDFSSHFSFNSVGDVLAVASQVGADVVISLDVNNNLTLQNFNLADLDGRDFIFSNPAEAPDVDKAVVAEEQVINDKPVISDDDSFTFAEKAVVSDDQVYLSDDFIGDHDELTAFLEALQDLRSDFSIKESVLEFGHDADGELSYFADFYNFA